MWGYDVASPPVLFDIDNDGKTIPAVGQASKLGWYFVHDRRDGTLMMKSDAYVPQENMFQAPTPEGVVIWPGVAGGSNWSPAAVDIKNGVAFVAAMHMPTRYHSAELPAADGKPAVTYYTFAGQECCDMGDTQRRRSQDRRPSLATKNGRAPDRRNARHGGGSRFYRRG